MRKINQILAIVLVSFAVVSCSEDLLNPPSTDPSLTATTSSETLESVSPYCGTQTFTLWAGQTINAGTVTVSNDALNLYVTVVSNGGYEGTENIKMWLGTDLTLVNGGGLTRPAAGHFPYKTTVPEGETTFTFTVPLSTIPFYNVSVCGVQSIYVYVHADVLAIHEDGSVSGETAWGGDVAGPGRAWWYYATYVPSCCVETPPPPSYEKLGTAFAKGGYVFTTDRKSNPENLPSLNLTKNRWGWAINLTNAGSFTYDLFVGAGLNNTSRGKLVGSVTIDYTGTQATVTYNLNATFAIEEGHVFAGDFRPTTLAPGQYGNTFYFSPFATTHSFTVDVTDTDGDGAWFIVHAVAYGPGVTNVM